jgi:hypothetical protein
VPKETSDKELEEAESAVAPLVAIAAGIVDDKLLLNDKYPEEDDALLTLRCPRDLHKY